MKKINLLFLFTLMVSYFSASAVTTDTDINIKGLNLPQLIISEVRPDNERTAYVELTNMGDSALDLSNFDLHSIHFNTRLVTLSDSLISFNRANEAVDNTLGKVKLHGILQAKESFVVSSVWDANDEAQTGIPNFNTAIAELSDQVVNKDESLNTYGWIDIPKWHCYGKDSVSYYSSERLEQLRAEMSAGYLIHWHFTTDSGTVDSTYIDQFNLYRNADYDYADYQVNMLPIAGVDDAMTTSVMIRKTSVTQGNMNWDVSRGSSASNSEWLVIPKNTSRVKAFTTVGSHGVSSLDYKVSNSDVVLDATAKTISVPWEMVRGDSLTNYFDLGVGMAWSYDRNSSFLDSSAYIARTGDKFSFYSVGDELDVDEFTINVRQPEDNVAKVFPVRRLSVNEEEILDENGLVIDTLVTRTWPVGFVYGVTDIYEDDSILNVGFGTRTDTLLKYLDSPAGSNLEFVFVDGQDRVDLKFGDILKVTAKDGVTIKEYIISVEEYERNSDALLKTVTWPDVDAEVYYKWTTGDTLPGFDRMKTEYSVELDRYQETIPALQFKTNNLKARIEVKNAIDIDGTDDQRTTSVTVFAEDDTTFLTYNFKFFRNGVKVQPNVAEPFISEMIWNVNTQGCALEIYNPGTEDLDLSKYMYVAGTTSQTWQEAVEHTVPESAFTSSDGIKIYQTHYCPSKRWTADTLASQWGQTGTEENGYVGAGFLKDDGVTDSWVSGHDVWVLGVGTSATDARQIKIRAESDFIMRGAGESLYAWDNVKILHRETPIWNDPRHNMWLLKMVNDNDSIRDGKMNVKDASKYELIDRFEIIGDTIAGRLCKGKNWSLVRKPSVTQGTLDRTGGGYSTPENSEWILRKGTDEGVGNDAMVMYLGSHVMDPVTNYKSTVTSTKFVVTTGYEGDELTITGDVTAYTAATFSAMLDKADSSQVFVYMRGTTVLDEDATLAADDVLSVTSGDESSTTNYTLVNSPLGTSTALTAVSGSSLSVIDTKVTNVVVGTSIKDLLKELEVDDKSVINVLDANGALQPLMMHDRDTSVYDVLVSSSVFIQVVAENSDQATYSLDFGVASDEAVLFSSLLTIYQDKKMIFGLPFGSTAESTLRVLSATEGATILIKDRAGFVREVGNIVADDVVEVTAADGTTKVIYTFIDDISNSIFAPRANKSLTTELFPNPVSDVLNVKGMDVVSIDIYSLSGAVILSQPVFGNSINVSGLPFGIYMIKLTDVDGKVALNKFLKK